MGCKIMVFRVVKHLRSMEKEVGDERCLEARNQGLS